MARVQFQHVDHASQEQWWYPMRALHMLATTSSSSSASTNGSEDVAKACKSFSGAFFDYLLLSMMLL